MAAILQKFIFFYWFAVFWLKFHKSLFLTSVSINNNSVLIQIMALCWTGTKPLSEPMMAYFTDLYESHGLNDLSFESPIHFQTHAYLSYLEIMTVLWVN